MYRHDVKAPEDALAYLLDCSLATVEDMARKKKRPALEYKRQILIAQINLDWAIAFGSDIRRTRAMDVIEYRNNVSAWAKSQEYQGEPK